MISVSENEECLHLVFLRSSSSGVLGSGLSTFGEQLDELLVEVVDILPEVPDEDELVE